jgi:beta-lactamase regulating signal transducer with metallopeptidase domain
MNTFQLFLLYPLGVLLLRWTVLFALAWMADAMMRRSHPRWRMTLWRGVLVLGCLLPFVGVVPINVFRIDSAATLARGSSPTNSSAASAVRITPALPLEPRPTLRAAEGLLTVKSGTTLVALVWIVGGAAGVIRLLLLQLRLARLRRSASEPDPELLALAKDVKVRLGVRQAVAVRVSDKVTSPFVCGLIHPTVILYPANGTTGCRGLPGEFDQVFRHRPSHPNKFSD